MYDDEQIECREISHRYHRARRQHRDPCPCCRQPIKPGEQYQVWVGVVDGEFTVMKRHTRECWDDDLV